MKMALAGGIRGTLISTPNDRGRDVDVDRKLTKRN